MLATSLGTKEQGVCQSQDKSEPPPEGRLPNATKG